MEWSLVVAGFGEASRSFAEGLAKSLGSGLCMARFKRFPDGEEYVRLEGCRVRGLDVVVVQTMEAPQSSSLLTAMLLADAAREAGASRLALAAPYMAYARQDRVFLEGEPVSVRAAMKALYATGYDVLVTVEIHKEYSLRFFPGRSYSIYPFEKLAKAAGVDCGSDVIVAPDRGALGRAERLARALGCRYGYLVKERDRVTGEVRLADARIEAEGARAVIVDDIISTGGTIALASEALLSSGSSSVIVLAAHYLGLPGARERLSRAGVSRVYAANPLPRSDEGLVEYVDVSDLAASVLREA